MIVLDTLKTKQNKKVLRTYHKETQNQKSKLKSQKSTFKSQMPKAKSQKSKVKTQNTKKVKSQ